MEWFHQLNFGEIMKNVKNLVSCDSNAIEDMEKHVLKNLVKTYLKIKEDIKTLDKAIELVGKGGSSLRKRWHEEHAKLQVIAKLLP